SESAFGHWLRDCWFVKSLSRIGAQARKPERAGRSGVSSLSYPQAHLTNRTKPMNPQVKASGAEAIMSKSKKMPPPPENPTKANVPTAVKTKLQASQAHQGR